MIVIILSFVFFVIGLQIFKYITKTKLEKIKPKVIGFFHPFWWYLLITSDTFVTHLLSYAGGGGERVLWKMISLLLDDEYNSGNYCVAIYTGFSASISNEIILEKVEVNLHRSMLHQKRFISRRVW